MNFWRNSCQSRGCSVPVTWMHIWCILDELEVYLDVLVVLYNGTCLTSCPTRPHIAG